MHIDNKCPLCNDSRIESMPISYDEIYRLDRNTTRGLVLKFSRKWEKIMNTGKSEELLKLVAKTCGCNKDKSDNTNNTAGISYGRKVIYSFVDNYHSLCLDKKDILSAELEACERLLKQTKDEIDKKIIETEIAELKMTLDLMR